MFIVILCYCHFADYQIVLKVQNITHIEFKWFLYVVHFSINVRIEITIWINTVMSVSDIWPIPLFKLMLLCLSYLADANTHPMFSWIYSNCPFVFPVVSYFTDTVCYPTYWPKAIFISPIDSAAEHCSVDIHIFMLQPRTPFELLLCGRVLQCFRGTVIMIVSHDYYFSDY